MKKLIVLVILLPLLIHSQKQYLNISADIRNGAIGSKPTNNNSALDLIILGGVTNKDGITIEAGYEKFKVIGFSKMFIGIGYTLITPDKALECVITVEPTYIDRDWGSYTSVGASARITYNISETLGISLLENVLLRTDNADRYNTSPPKIFSTYLGITYTFKRN